MLGELVVAAVGDLDAGVGAVRCPSRTVVVTVTNAGDSDESYSLIVGGRTVRTEVIIGDSTLRSTVELAEDRRTRIRVRALGTDVTSTVRTANCRRAHGQGHGKTRTLPKTGTGTSLAVTSGATILTGALLSWYGLLWPRRRPTLFP
ncbi:LPXTG cell wall anchor domain-containing protein [Actinocorallia longicatena]|uniref:LPXTG cell wall anchor domain-containing protein n=1 Tax=Actinocorallia longicatena TaxID=111803 RepID=A0ABP6QKD2_9ACTN